jgi:hypothetical protein
MALALSGCASSAFTSTADDREVRTCQRASVDVPAWNVCIEAHNARVATREAREAQTQQQRHTTDSEDDATMLLLGGTAFLNGYNQARPVTTTCFTTGMMTQCTSP